MEALWEHPDGDSFRVSWNLKQTTVRTEWFAAFDNSAPFGGEEWDWSLSEFGKEESNGFNVVDNSEENIDAVRDVSFLYDEEEFLHDEVIVASSNEILQTLTI